MDKRSVRTFDQYISILNMRVFIVMYELSAGIVRA